MWHEYIDVSIYDNQYNNRQRLYIPGHRVWSGRVNLPLNYCYNMQSKRCFFIYLKCNQLICGRFSKKGGMWNDVSFIFDWRRRFRSCVAKVSSISSSRHGAEEEDDGSNTTRHGTEEEDDGSNTTRHGKERTIEQYDQKKTTTSTGPALALKAYIFWTSWPV